MIVSGKSFGNYHIIELIKVFNIIICLCLDCIDLTSCPVITSCVFLCIFTLTECVKLRIYSCIPDDIYGNRRSYKACSSSACKIISINMRLNESCTDSFTRNRSVFRNLNSIRIAGYLICDIFGRHRNILSAVHHNAENYLCCSVDVYGFCGSSRDSVLNIYTGAVFYIDINARFGYCSVA